MDDDVLTPFSSKLLTEEAVGRRFINIFMRRFVVIMYAVSFQWK